jgi:pimeloyl-ACP methyl ester carboxylesterase
VWLVGTSRGTVSGTAAAIALGPKIAGLVLTASITSRAFGAVPTQDIGKIQVPVLVLHHQRDACRLCVPDEARRMTAGFRSASVRKFIMVDGGSDPEGDPCEARHWHGFINYEKEAVKLLTDWMLKPQL